MKKGKLYVFKCTNWLCKKNLNWKIRQRDFLLLKINTFAIFRSHFEKIWNYLLLSQRKENSSRGCWIKSFYPISYKRMTLSVKIIFRSVKALSKHFHSTLQHYKIWNVKISSVKSPKPRISPNYKFSYCPSFNFHLKPQILAPPQKPNY